MLPAFQQKCDGQHADRYWDNVYQTRKLDAQSSAPALQFSPLFGKPEDWHEIVGRSLDDYRSGRSLMDHLGVDRLIDPALTGMLLAIRRGLVEEVNAVSISDYVLIDMVVIAFANAMLIQSIVGKHRSYPGIRDVLPADAARTLEEGLWLPPRGHPRARCDDHVARPRGDLLPLAERFHRMAEAGIEALRRQRREPSVEVERVVPVSLRVVRPV